VTRQHRYLPRAIAFEAAQGAAGFLLMAGLLSAAQPAGPVIWALAAAASSRYFGRAVFAI
jgi:hypothetical protein